ncbi:MAG: HNH endonuclease [Desulfotalea sp.]
MPSQYASARQNAFNKQNGSCYYCGRPMWQSKPKKFAKKHDISEKEARQLQCTAEHLKARCDGGGNQKENIVAACSCCNQKRHQRKKQLSSSQYKKHVSKRLKNGKWFPKRLNCQNPLDA